MQRLKQISVRLETVTPTWLGGAGSVPELRPPSIRGCMRFWLRALLGGTLGQDSPSLLKAEGAVMGDTSRASPVVVRIKGENPQIGPATLSAEQFPGANYMYWSTYQRRRDAILPGEVFDLHVQSRPWSFPSVEVQGVAIGDQEAFHFLAAALWLLLRLGGVGARVRRGAGTLGAMVHPDGWPETVPTPLNKASTPEELASELAGGLQTIRRSMPWTAAVPQGLSQFDLLHHHVCQILVADQTFPTWWEALDWIGRQLQEFRRTHRADVSAIAELLTRGRMTVRAIQRAVLGLPIVFFIKSIFESLTQSGVPSNEARRKASATVAPDRRLGRASPLLVRIVRLAGESPQYAVMMVLFRSRFLPDRQIAIRPQDRSIRPAWVDVPTNHVLIDNWFDFLRSGGTVLRPVPFESEKQHA